MWVAQVHYPSCTVNAYLVSSSASIPQMCGIHVWGSAIFQREKLKEWSPLVAVFQLVIAVVLVACTTGLLNILAIHLLNRHSLTDHLHQDIVVCKDF